MRKNTDHIDGQSAGRKPNRYKSSNKMQNLNSKAKTLSVSMTDRHFKHLIQDYCKIKMKKRLSCRKYWR